MKIFETVTKMKLATLNAGQIIETKSYYGLSDSDVSGGARYKVLTPVQYGGTPDEYGDHTLANGNIAKLVVGGAVNVKQFGAIGDGVTDDKGAIESALNSGVKVLETKEGDSFLISSTISISAINGISLRGKGKFVNSGFQQCLIFDGCDNLVIDGFIGQGDLDRVAWEALTTPQRQSQIAFIEVSNSYNTRMKDVFVSGFSQGVRAENTTFSEYESITLVGCFGEVSGGLVTDPNYGYNLSVIGGKNITIINAISDECSGAVLVGDSAERVKSYGGTAKNCHDNGWYGSSTLQSLCDGFSVESGGAQTNAVKMRGNNNIISNCTAKNFDNIAFSISPLASISALDSQGAYGHGGGIYNCEAQNTGSLARVDKAVDSATNLYMRDVEILGNKGFDLISAGQSPIEILALKNVEVSGNIINSFTNTLGAIFAGGESAGVPVTNVNIHHNHIEGGEKIIAYTFATQCKFNNNTFEGMSGGVILNAINTGVDNEFNHNTSSDKTRRFDLRQSSGSFGSTAINNDLFIQVLGNVDGEARAFNNELDTNVDISIVIPSRAGDVVKGTTGFMYIADGTAGTSNWNQIT